MTDKKKMAQSERTKRHFVLTHGSLNLVFSPLFWFLHFPSLHAELLHAQSSHVLNTPTPVLSLYVSVRCVSPVLEWTSCLTESCFADPEHNFPRQDVNVNSPLSFTDSVSFPVWDLETEGGRQQYQQQRRRAGGWEEVVIWWIQDSFQINLLHFTLSPILPSWCPILF